jgi:hypothetical protein
MTQYRACLAALGILEDNIAPGFIRPYLPALGIVLPSQSTINGHESNLKQFLTSFDRVMIA